MTTTEQYATKIYLYLQIKEFDEHKWIKSEEQGRDIGNQEAWQDWIKSGQAKRYHDSYMANQEAIEAALIPMAESGQLEKITKAEVHKLLHDADPQLVGKP